MVLNKINERTFDNVYAVSDLHGNYNLWKQIINSLGEKDILYVLGDCADRGEDGWRIIKEALADPRVEYIKGNHDQMLLDAWKSDWVDLELWFWNGGEPTFNAVINDHKADLYLKELDQTAVCGLYQPTPESKQIYLCHAGFTPTIYEKDENLLWDRDHILDAWPVSPDWENTYIIHGHSPVVSKSCFGLIDIELNNSKTVGRYAGGHKIDIDGRTILSKKCAMLNLDTLEEKVFVDEV